MNLFLRILAVLAGIMLILPGLCTLYFGGIFTISGGYAYGIPMVIAGGLLAFFGSKVINLRANKK